MGLRRAGRRRSGLVPLIVLTVCPPATQYPMTRDEPVLEPLIPSSGDIGVTTMGSYGLDCDTVPRLQRAAAERSTWHSECGVVNTLASQTGRDEPAIAEEDPWAAQQNSAADTIAFVEDQSTYSREFILHIGLALYHLAPVPEDVLQIATCPRPQEEPLQHKPEETIAKLVDIGGGRVKIGNLAAAGLALGIMSGGHGKICQDILTTVRARPDLFGPVPKGVPVSDTSKLNVCLARPLSTDSIFEAASTCVQMH